MGFAAEREDNDLGPGHRLAVLIGYACKVLDPAEVQGVVAQTIGPWVLGEEDQLIAWLDSQARVEWPPYQPPPPIPMPDIDIRWTKWGPELCGMPGWAEQDHDGWTIRQIEKQAVGDQPRAVFPERTEDRWYLSSWGDGLGEGQLAPEDMWAMAQQGSLEVITQVEFEATWQAALASRQDEWAELKASLPIGTRLQGTSRFIWGRLGWVAVDLERPFLGVIPLSAYRALAETRGGIIGVDWSLSVAVDGFDDDRQWIVLKLEHEALRP